mgnify:CR=1 FL=1
MYICIDGIVIAIFKTITMSKLIVNNNVHIINDIKDITKQLVLILNCYPADARVAFIKS